MAGRNAIDPRVDEGASKIVEAVHFNFFSTEEIQRMSVKKITKPELFDKKGAPVPDGLYDPALGPINDGDSCKSCGQVSSTCPGHCGHIDLALPIFNPLLFRILCNLLQISCFFCHKFRISERKVQMYATQLDLIINGDIVGARNIDARSSTLFSDANSENDDVSSSNNLDHDFQKSNQKSWTTLQHTEAHSVFVKFMREKIKKCQNCGMKNPAISSPSHGYINMAMRNSDSSANAIHAHNHKPSSISAPKSIHSPNTEDHSEDILSQEELAPSNESSGPASVDTHHTSLMQKKSRNLLSGQLLPSEAKYHLERLWENETRLCTLICDVQQMSSLFSKGMKSYMIFLMEAIVVPPSRFRPTSKGNDRGTLLEHPQNILLTRILESNDAIINSKNTSDRVRKWEGLQRSVNVLFDSSKGFGKEKETTGLRQLLEKKAGILRQKMMGKRVNYACRSVISPDPYLAVNEIGIPPHFALKLTYPEKVTPWNVNKLRQHIINGLEFHPGATHYKDRENVYMLQLAKNARISISRKLPTSRGSNVQQGKGPECEFEGKTVYRHMQDGDVVLVNRQPTLHKISMMAFIVRVLKGEKTLRMHYANCSSFNADFDGDEMNVHLPQDEVSRSEAFNIVNANRQFVKPANGQPIRGLIQDHIVSAVLLTMKGTFLTREEYHQLLYASLVPPTFRGSWRSGKKVYALLSDSAAESSMPTILKPLPLWSGKQVITAILNHVTRGHNPFFLRKRGKINKKYFNEDKDHEMKVLIRGNELLHGMIDKEQFGLYGLVHTVHELYGPDTAGVLLSTFSRLFTAYLQMHGFTCGVDDLLLVPSNEVKRKKYLENCEPASKDAHYDFVGATTEDRDPMKLQRKIEEILRSNGEAASASLDRKMSNSLNKITTGVNEIIHNGLLKPFFKNCVSLMTATGAKGSAINFSQISLLLGQQELEGKRVPRMVSGKTLPCFPPWDISSRAGGFIGDRFLTGLRPQEYYFHCMAGREGLVDTAIKTSRSGYLQRCLIKNLESLKICYDHSVRDVDGSIIQFVYGEDGVDVHQASFLHQFKALAANQDVWQSSSSKKQSLDLSSCNSYFMDIPYSLKKKAKEFYEKLPVERRDYINLKDEKSLMRLVKLKYLNSLAHPGEAVGVLASQSLGEQTTQMTLNTFHLAGRGDVNVTLGIPRLQEILMSAKENIRTPVMTCPLREGITREKGDLLAMNLRRICLANIIQSMEVSVVPFYILNGEIVTIYKLKMKLYSPELFPQFSEITLEDCREILENDFVAAMELAIKKHLGTLIKIRGIQSALHKKEENSVEGDGEMGDEPIQGKENDLELSGDEDEITDQGADAEKRKKQVDDEVEYDDDVENCVTTVDDGLGQLDDANLPSGFESEVDNPEAADEDFNIGEDFLDISNDQEELESLSNLEAKDYSGIVKEDKKPEVVNKTVKQRRKKKDFDRVIFLETRGLEFEVHFKFQNEPHVLLAEVAQRTAKSVYLKQSDSIQQCSLIEKKTKREDAEKGEETTFLLQTAGVSFPVFWDMEDYLDITEISTNDIHAILKTYGVEAARATIINEVQEVFNAYGISMDNRHLSVIADFMTFNGDYRPMNRLGMTNFSTSPFSKITFETATKFVVEAAFHGEIDRVDSASSSICLGQPVKMGTGCFELLQNLQP